MSAINGRRVTDQLRAAIQQQLDDRRTTLYALAKETGLGYYTIARFVSGERPDIRASSLDALCGHLGLELRGQVM
jgi:DNA-binding Xre family transcriptional regulator